MFGHQTSPLLPSLGVREQVYEFNYHAFTQKSRFHPKMLKFQVHAGCLWMFWMQSCPGVCRNKWTTSQIRTAHPSSATATGNRVGRTQVLPDRVRPRSAAAAFPQGQYGQQKLPEQTAPSSELCGLCDHLFKRALMAPDSDSEVTKKNKKPHNKQNGKTV